MSDQKDYPLFSGKNLACRRGGGAVFGALDFSIFKGGGLLLRGPNGSGKSTLLRMMAGLIRPIEGELCWRGAPISEEEHAARLCYVGHQDAAKPLLSAYENLRFWAGLDHKGEERERMTQKALGVFGLAPLSDRLARALSAGQRRRLSLARLLIRKAPLWLLDEPANALDDKSLSVLEKVVAAHRAQGGIVVMAAHGSVFASGWEVLDMGAFEGGRAHDPASMWL